MAKSHNLYHPIFPQFQLFWLHLSWLHEPVNKVQLPDKVHVCGPQPIAISTGVTLLQDSLVQLPHEKIKSSNVWFLQTSCSSHTHMSHPNIKTGSSYTCLNQGAIRHWWKVSLESPYWAISKDGLPGSTLSLKEAILIRILNTHLQRACWQKDPHQTLSRGSITSWGQYWSLFYPSRTGKAHHPVSQNTVLQCTSLWW